MGIVQETVEIIIKASDKASGTIKGITGSLGGIGKFAGGLAIAGLGLATVATTAAITGLGLGIKIAVDEAMEAQNVMAQLNAVLNSTGGAAGVTAEMVTGLADQYQSLTKFEDDAIISGETVLLQFSSIGKDIFPQATQAMLDLAQRSGMAMPAAAKLIGRAFEGNIGALGRYGVVFDDVTKKTIDDMIKAGDTAGAQQIILEKMTQAFGGAATEAGKTLEGQMIILQNSLKDIAEGAGTALLPVLTQGLQAITPILIDLANQFATFVASDQFKKWLADASAFLTNTAIPALQDFAGWITGTVIPALIQFYTWFSANIVPILITFWTTLTTKVIPNIITLGKEIGEKITKLVEGFKKAWDDIVTTFDNLATAIEGAYGWIKDLIKEFKDFMGISKDFEIPEGLQPRNSPSDFELSLLGVANAMRLINSTPMPVFPNPITLGSQQFATASVGSGKASAVVSVTVNMNAPILGFSDKYALGREITNILDDYIARKS